MEVTFAFDVMTFRRCTHVYRLLAPGNISTKSPNKKQKDEIQNMKYIYTQTPHNCMQLFDTPGKDDLHKVHCFFGFGNGFDLSLCYGTANIHHLLYAQASLCSKNPNTNNVTIKKASMQGKGVAQLFISWTRSR